MKFTYQKTILAALLLCAGAMLIQSCKFFGKQKLAEEPNKSSFQ
jgi:hypothetical protein